MPNGDSPPAIVGCRRGASSRQTSGKGGTWTACSSSAWTSPSTSTSSAGWTPRPYLSAPAVGGEPRDDPPARHADFGVVRWLLGTTFAWHDVACYVVGVAAIFGADVLLLRPGREGRTTVRR